MDIVFVSPSNSKAIYQELSNKYSAIEPPTWALLLAESCRSKGFKVSILDCNAEGLSIDQSYQRLSELSPKLICFVVYGQNVNAGTTSMSGATALSNYIKKKNNKFVISYVGSHVQSLPLETLQNENSIDFVFVNEGVYALHNVLKLNNFTPENLSTIKGLAYKDNNGVAKFTKPEIIVPQDRMDIDLPGYAWDLLPFKSNPLDLYRSPLWHANYIEDQRKDQKK